ncbi:MAG: acyl-CoA dehydrogenase family protein [Acidobacteriota bacterium]
MTDSRQQQIVNEARAFAAAEILPRAAEFDAREALPRDLIHQLAARGYLAASFPEEYGGLGLDPVYYGLLTEEIGKGCSSTRALLTVHTSMVGETLLRWGTPAQKSAWLPVMARGEKLAAFALTEPDVGTDAKSVATSYQEAGDGFVLNGRKRWISFGDIADVLLVVASHEGQITAFLVERASAGVATRRMTGLLAGRAAHIAEVDLTDVFVPDTHVLGKVGNGFPYVVATTLDHGRYSIAWAGVALAQAAVDAMVTYARQRRQFGRKIHSFQLVQGMIADAVTKTHAARALCLRAGELRKAAHHDASIETSIAKYFASKVAMEVAIDAVQVHGGNGCSNQYPVERIFREAKILEIIEGTSQVQQEMIAGYGLRRYFRP